MDDENQDYKEWVTARKSIDKFDGYTVNIRKYGFTFITGIITAQAILTPTPISYPVKFSVIVVTMALILAIALFEQYIRIMQHAAVQRALILERRLNIELTELIGFQYTLNHGNYFKYALYIVFIFGTCLFAFFIIGINPDQLFENQLPLDQIIEIMGVIILFVLSIISLIIIFHVYKYKIRPDGEDWTVDKVVCQRGKNVKITLTNVNNDKRMSIDPCSMVEIKREDNKEPPQKLYHCNLYHHIEIGPGNNFTWLWNTKNCSEGIYQICPKNREDPLQRKIMILNNKKEEKQEKNVNIDLKMKYLQVIRIPKKRE